MGKAIHYALDHWESLEVYLQDPLIEIDNNLVENGSPAHCCEHRRGKGLILPI